MPANSAGEAAQANGRRDTSGVHAGYVDWLILETLYVDNATHSHELADAIGVPPYLVRGSLSKLARERLVEDLITSRGHEWRLTSRGLAYTESECQVETRR